MNYQRIFIKIKFSLSLIFTTIVIGLTTEKISDSQPLDFKSCDKFSDCNIQKTKEQVSGNNGVVVTTQHEASQVGLEILKKGGNAVDAAVAIGYALAVTDPCCGNIGGGGFMMIHQANGKQVFINFREKAPLAATAKMYLDNNGNVVPQLSKSGYLAVAVPGTVLGLDHALLKYGTMSRKKVMSLAINLAEKGFVLKEGDIKIFQAGNKNLQDPSVSSIFLKDGKQSYQVGDILIQKDLARTLRLISEGGSDSFYKGEIAKKIVASSQKNGGILSLKDFQHYTISEQQPLKCNYRGYDVSSAPPPGGGITVCQMLNILEGYPLAKLGFHTTKSLHYMFSAMLYAYGDRNYYLGDPDFVEIPVSQLISKQYAAQIRKKIPANKAINPQTVYNRIAPEGTNTTHYSVIDRYGNAVSVTYTINSYFGAGVIAEGTGFLLNNEMDDFTSKVGVPNQFGLVQGNANIIEPKKRPLSSMSPTIVTKNGKVFLVTGSPGGSTIPTTILQVLINVIDYQMNVSQAVNSPKVHYQGLPNKISRESLAINDQVLQELLTMGYEIKTSNSQSWGSWGAAETILVDPKTGVFFGVNDGRKPAGKAMAY